MRNYKLYYRAIPTDRWMSVLPDMISEHDFKGNNEFAVMFEFESAKEKQTAEFKDYRGFKIYKEFLEMADYSKAEPDIEDKNEDSRIRAAVNPSHYKSHMEITATNGKMIDRLQWFEHLQFMPFYREHPMAFYHLCMAQADKYQSRLGKKDNPAQEAKKALWYYCFGVAFLQNDCKPIRVRDILSLLNLEFT